MAVVTVTRQYGAGGSRVAAAVAEGLGWTLVDNAFVAAVAERAGLPIETVELRQERAPSLMERMVRALATASPEVFVPGPVASAEPAEDRIVRVTEHVIAEAAAAGRAVVVGRGAQFVLGHLESGDALHVYVVAPRDTRVRTVADRMGIGFDEAAVVTDRTDADRDRYVERYYARKRQDPANYHVVVNTGRLGYDAAAALIVEAARRRGWT